MTDDELKEHLAEGLVCIENQLHELNESINKIITLLEETK